jgi:hypothetical protein
VIRTHVIAAVCGFLVLAFMLELLRRRQLREKYAILWIGVSVVVVILAAFPSLLNWMAHRLGIYDPPNLLLFSAVLVLLLVAVHLSWEASRLEEETRTLAEEIGLLRMQVDSLHPNPIGANAARAAAEALDSHHAHEPLGSNQASAARDS